MVKRTVIIIGVHNYVVVASVGANIYECHAFKRRIDVFVHQSDQSE